MNDDVQYSRGVVVAAGGWLSTALMLLLAWATWVIGGPSQLDVAILIAETACVLSAVAAVLNLRCYAARICRLIRVTNGLERPRDAEVREFSPRH